MAAPGSDGDVLAAALIQIAAHAERIGSLDARETTNYQHITANLQNLATEMTAVSARIGAPGDKHLRPIGAHGHIGADGTAVAADPQLNSSGGLSASPPGAVPPGRSRAGTRPRGV